MLETSILNLPKSVSIITKSKHYLQIKSQIMAKKTV